MNRINKSYKFKRFNESVFIKNGKNDKEKQFFLNEKSVFSKLYKIAVFFKT